MNSALTIFVCGTFWDLGAEREAVLDAIRRLQLQHDSMEFFGARDGQPIETCLEEVQRSEVLVVIVGHLYGSLVPELGVSFSEAEYNEGHRLKKPCLVYIRDDSVPVLPKHVERNPEKLKLLEAWKSTLEARHTVARFQQSNDLAVQVAADLGRTMNGLEEAAHLQEEAKSGIQTDILDELSPLVVQAVEQGVAEGDLLSSIRRAVASSVAKAQQLSPLAFFSYAREDREIVHRIAKGLEDENIRVWSDISDIKPGSDWVREIQNGLDSADLLVFFISQHSIRSPWTQKEINLALSRKLSGGAIIPIIPVLLEHVEHMDIPPLLRDIQWLDLTDEDPEMAVKQLAKWLRYVTGR